MGWPGYSFFCKLSFHFICPLCQPFAAFNHFTLRRGPGTDLATFTPCFDIMLTFFLTEYSSESGDPDLPVEFLPEKNQAGPGIFHELSVFETSKIVKEW